MKLKTLLAAPTEPVADSNVLLPAKGAPTKFVMFRVGVGNLPTDKAAKHFEAVKKQYYDLADKTKFGVIFVTGRSNDNVIETIG